VKKLPGIGLGLTERVPAPTLVVIVAKVRAERVDVVLAPLAPVDVILETNDHAPVRAETSTGCLYRKHGYGAGNVYGHHVAQQMEQTAEPVPGAGDQFLSRGKIRLDVDLFVRRRRKRYSAQLIALMQVPAGCARFRYRYEVTVYITRHIARANPVPAIGFRKDLELRAAFKLAHARLAGRWSGSHIQVPGADHPFAGSRR
jgi:hypothetical protein